jgi:hypothetical protein
MDELVPFPYEEFLTASMAPDERFGFKGHKG